MVDVSLIGVLFFQHHSQRLQSDGSVSLEFTQRDRQRRLGRTHRKNAVSPLQIPMQPLAFVVHCKALRSTCCRLLQASGVFGSSQFPLLKTSQTLKWEGVWRELGCLAPGASFAVREESGHSLKSSLSVSVAPSAPTMPLVVL